LEQRKKKRPQIFFPQTQKIRISAKVETSFEKHSYDLFTIENFQRALEIFNISQSFPKTNI
jgi:hypothetical protein